MLRFKCYGVSFLHIVQVRSNICPICQQASECSMQRMMLAAVQATAERLIAPRHLMGQMFERTRTICSKMKHQCYRLTYKDVTLPC